MRNHSGRPLRASSCRASLLLLEPRVQPRSRLSVVVLHHPAEPHTRLPGLRVALIQVVEPRAAQGGRDFLAPVQQLETVYVGASEESKERLGQSDLPDSSGPETVGTYDRLIN